MTQKTVAVLFGGRSSEHEISLRSACFALKSIPSKFNVLPVGIARSGAMVTTDRTFPASQFSAVTPADLAQFIAGKPLAVCAGANVERALFLPYPEKHCKEVASTIQNTAILNLKADVFFPVLHGSFGEDGLMQALFEHAEKPYIGCDVRASVIGIDKDIQKRLSLQAGVPICKYTSVVAEEWETKRSEALSRVKKEIGFPCFVKPNALGSSVGASPAKNDLELERAIGDALRFDDRALIEEELKGSEIECAFLGTATNPKMTRPGELSGDEWYSYDQKYGSESKINIHLPARLEPAVMKKVMGMAETLAKAFNLSGLCRIDFWHIPKTGAIYFNEINTLPGMTSISQFPKLWEMEGVGAEQWILENIEIAEKRCSWNLRRSLENK